MFFTNSYSQVKGEKDDMQISLLSKLKNYSREISSLKGQIKKRPKVTVNYKNVIVYSSFEELEAIKTDELVFVENGISSGLFKLISKSNSTNVDFGVYFKSSIRNSIWKRVFDGDEILVDWYRHSISDDITDEIKRAMRTAALLKKYVSLPAGVFKISRPIIVPKGLLGVYGKGKLATILIPRSYLEVTFHITYSGNYSDFTIGEYRALNNRINSNGVLIQGELASEVVNNSVVLSTFENIRILGLNGYGFKIENVYDSYFKSISVELCGNSDEYAFSVNSINGETTNMSNWDQLKVEQSDKKAIYIGPDVFSCVFSNIHSERTSDAKDLFSYVLGGNRCLYESIRIHNRTEKSSLRISGYNTTFINFGVESPNTVLLEGVNGSDLNFINSYLPFSELSTVQNQIGNIYFNSGTFRKGINDNQNLHFKYGLFK